jgi:Na+-translocating ferredoxin:NAD+ oxidoreductase RnfD subunit
MEWLWARLIISSLTAPAITARLCRNEERVILPDKSNYLRSLVLGVSVPPAQGLVEQARRCGDRKTSRQKAPEITKT